MKRSFISCPHKRRLAEQFPGPDVRFARHMVLSFFYARNELYADAIGELGALLRAEPDNVVAWLELADLHRVTGNEPGREFALLKAARLADEQGDPFSF